VTASLERTESTPAWVPGTGRVRPVELRWHERATDLPAYEDDRGELFAGRAWLSAWERATIEDVADRRYLSVQDADGPPVTLALYLIEDSPYWHGYEQEVGIEATFEGPIACLPSLYSIYGPIVPANLEAVACALPTAEAQARRWNAEALVVGNLTAAVAHELTARCPPTVAVRLDTSWRIVLPERPDSYFASLKRDHRADLRRRWRRARERGVVLTELCGQDAEERLPEFLALADASAIKHGTDPIYDLPTLASLLDVPGSGLLLAERDGEALSGYLTFACGRSLIVWSGGIRYSALREFSPYVFLLYEAVCLAYERGWRVLDFGRGNGAFKARHGASPVALWSLFYFRDSEAPAAARLARLHELLAARHP
jgi:hypothetical protein